MARRARRVDARQEQQLDHDEPLALAGLAAALGDVEREPPGVVAPGARRLRRGEQLADVVEQAGVGREVRARRAADRLLVDAHQPLDVLHARRRSGRRACAAAGRSSSLAFLVVRRDVVAEVLGDQLDQHLADQARLARAGHAGDGREHAERERDVEVVQVVAGDAGEPQPALRRARRARRTARARRTGSGASATPRPARARRAGRCRGSRRRARRRPGPTSTIQSAWRITSSSCSTTNSELPAAFSRSSARSSASVSAGMQARRRLVEHVHDAEQVRAHLRRQPQPLQLARRQRRRAALERQVAEPEVEQHGEPRHQVLGDPLRDHRLLRDARSPSFARPGAVPSAYGRKMRGQPLQRQRATSRRCPARRTSPTAPRGAAACRGRPGSRCSTMYCATRFFISGALRCWRTCAARSRRAPVNVPM